MKYRIPTYSFKFQNSKEALAQLFIWDAKQSYKFDESHSHTYNELLIFEKGEGNHFMSQKSYEISDYSFHILPSGFIHRLNRSANSKGFTIAFSDFFIDQLQKLDIKSDYSLFINEPKSFNYSENDYKDFSFYFKELHTHVDNEPYFLNLISLIILKILDKQKHKPNLKSEVNKKIEIMHLINKYYTQKPKIDFYAIRMNMSISCLTKRVKQTYGKTIIDLQNEKLIFEAKRLLLQNTLSVSDIALRFNFTDESHFCHFFKKHVTLTPKEFKRNCFLQ